MKNECILTRKTNMKEQVQQNKKMLDKTYQNRTIKKPQNDIQKTHMIRRFIISNTFKLTIIS